MRILMLVGDFPPDVFGGIGIYAGSMADEPGWLCLLSPLFALSLAMLAGFIWKKGIRRYGSAGG